eukprot:CAMPEP_0178899838 /NCGR_PEP_ID=MMETSP0786-20121207/3129_1 /TAXON_ID=186022 /ORGANISM="Thalassionema frauenfeldii, Strain CCMP 1798" /LENGTH=122 /DNA_ID=CAMNT_0020570753 /DNA_START=433 /DNA_END=801 /DNA_ORIENTATION=+
MVLPPRNPLFALVTPIFEISTIFERFGPLFLIKVITASLSTGCLSPISVRAVAFSNADDMASGSEIALAFPGTSMPVSAYSIPYMSLRHVFSDPFEQIQKVSIDSLAASFAVNKASSLDSGP